jgi:hypothetical protein
VQIKTIFFGNSWIVSKSFLGIINKRLTDPVLKALFSQEEKENVIQFIKDEVI